MKKRLLSVLLIGATISTLFAACGKEEAQPVAQQAAPATTEYQWDFAKKNGDIDELKQPCNQKGTVETVEYDTPAYAVNDIFGVDETLHKSMTVYLPYGYDENTQYNVLYLLHGTEGEGDGPMEEFWLKQWGDLTCNVLDNMIAQGLCDPVIVVCPTYYSRVEGYDLGDEQAKELSEKLSDSFIYSETAEDGGQPDNAQNIWPVYFGQELRNNIVPTVEATYSTYASGDVSDENLVATRDHRAFAGLSRGAMTIARAGLTDNVDLFSYYGSYSGAWQEFANFKTAQEETFKDYDIKFWYNGNGAGDFALENHKTFCDQALEELPDRFVDGENFAFVKLKDGAHMYMSWLADLYNSLLVFYN